MIFEGYENFSALTKNLLLNLEIDLSLNTCIQLWKWAPIWFDILEKKRFSLVEKRVIIYGANLNKQSFCH